MANITLRDFYDMVGGSYEDVVGRLMKEDRMSHNLKGMCQNLGLDSLARVSSDLCEQVRHGAPAVDISTYVEAVADEYAKNIGAINLLN